MGLKVKREGATPNLLKISVIADEDGGEITLSRADLLRDCVAGPLQRYITSGQHLGDAEAACRYLLCNPSMRAFVTPRSLARVAIDATVEGSTSSVALKIMAEAKASAIVALEFRHTIAA